MVAAVARAIQLSGVISIRLVAAFQLSLACDPVVTLRNAHGDAPVSGATYAQDARRDRITAPPSQRREESESRLMSTSSTLFDRILVPTDGSAAGAAAREVARRICERESGRLVLLRVESEHAPLEHVLADTASLARESSDLRDDGVASYYRVEYGSAADNIAVVAAEENASLIVLAHQHRGFLQGMRHPSVTARMFSRATAPLLIWPEGQPPDAYDDFLKLPGAVVLVPLDGSAEAERALPLAIQLARKYERILLLARVLVPLPIIAATGPAYVDPEQLERDNAEAREYLSATRQRLTKDTGLTVQSLLLEGDVAVEVGKALASHKGSLVVMTTHGRTGLGKLFLGSVATSLIDCASVPLLVLPPLMVERATEVVKANQSTVKATPADAPAFAPGAALT